MDFQGGKEFHWTPPQRQHVVAMYAKVNKTTDTTSQQHVSRLQRRVVQVSGRLRGHFDLKQRRYKLGGFWQTISLSVAQGGSHKYVNLW